MSSLSARLEDPEAIPDFLWDDPMTVAELKGRLRSASEPEQLRLLALILREARDPDVWLFTTPAGVLRNWPRPVSGLGRRRSFWEFLLRQWHQQFQRCARSRRSWAGHSRPFALLRTSGVFLFTRRDDAVLIDLVRDRVPQIALQKLDHEGILVDLPHEILANKLCALLSRGEVRDLVDVLALERFGLRVEDALGPASMKDGGITPAQLAWVLSQIQIGDDARVPGDLTARELRDFLEHLIRRLTLLAYPN